MAQTTCGRHDSGVGLWLAVRLSGTCKVLWVACSFGWLGTCCVRAPDMRGPCTVSASAADAELGRGCFWASAQVLIDLAMTDNDLGYCQLGAQREEADSFWTRGVNLR